MSSRYSALALASLLGASDALLLPSCCAQPTRLPASRVVAYQAALCMCDAGAVAPAHEPRTRCTCRIHQKIDIRLSVRQCSQLLQASSNLSSLAQRERYGRFRARPGEYDDHTTCRTAAALWQYARRCVEAEVGAHRRWSSWHAVRALCDKRREYLTLWSALQGGLSDTATSAKLRELEDELDINHILLFRNLEQRARIPPLPRSPRWPLGPRRGRR